MDPEVEGTGGIHRVWFGAVRAAVLSTYSTQHSRGVWGHAPPGKFRNLDHMRVLLKPP